MCKFKVGDQLLFGRNSRPLEILGVFDWMPDGFTKIYMYRVMDSKGTISYCSAAVIDAECKLI